MDFWHFICWRLWRLWMLLSTKSKGHKSNFRISSMYRYSFYNLKVHFWWPNIVFSFAQIEFEHPVFYILRHPVRVTVSSCQLMLCLRTDDANFLWPCHVTVSCDCYEIWSRSLGVIILKKFDMYVTYVIVPTIPFEQFWLTWKKDFDMSQVAQKNWCYIFTWPTKTTVKLAR